MAYNCLVIFFAAIFTENILLARFLGMCSFLAVSRQVKTAVGLGSAVTFVLAFTSVLNWMVYHYVLLPHELDYLRFIVFIIVIAAFVQFVEIVIERASPVLYYALGIFLPLITVNCAILGVALFMVIRDLGLRGVVLLWPGQRRGLDAGHRGDGRHTRADAKRPGAARAGGAGHHADRRRHHGAGLHRIVGRADAQVSRTTGD